MALKCRVCKTENDDDAVFCTHCREPLKVSAPATSEARQSRVGVMALAIFVAVLVGSFVAFQLYSQTSDSDDGELAGEGKEGTISITLVNPYAWGAMPCDFVVELNGQFERNGTVAVSDSVVVEKNLTVGETGLEVLIHVEVVGSTTQPEDVTVTIGPGETETVVMILHMTT